MMTTGTLRGVLPLLLLLIGCATPGTMRSAKASDLSRLEAGISVKAAQRAARTAGEPVALFIDEGRRCEIRKFMAKETGAPYYVLWIDDELRGVLPAYRGERIESRPPALQDGALPHSEGFQDLLDVFSDAPAPSEVDFAEMREGYRPRDKELERAELMMWAPLIIVMLPVLPLQLASVSKAAASHGPFYALEPGMSPEQVRRKIGEPREAWGEPAGYALWTYRHEPYEFDELRVSIGFRRNSVEWVRWGYYAGVDDEPD